jgi:phosphoribosylanthranilate isomerase
MASSTKIKLSPITNLSDARFAAAAGIEYMGFCFDPSSPDFLLPIKAREILEWTSGSHAIGEFGDQSIEEISELSDLLQMDVVLLNNSILPDELPQIAKPIIKAISLDDMGPVELANELCAYAPYADAFQLNGTQAIAARKDELIEACAQYKIVWNLPYTNENVLAILETYKPYSLVILAASEEKTGMKEYDELNEMLEILRP